MLASSSNASTQRFNCHEPLAVRGFTLDPVYDCRGLMYRKGESEYESDFYHEFLVAPLPPVTMAVPFHTS